MEIKVNEQAQKFHLATNQGNWQQAIGHEIQVGKYRFCAVPMGYHINVSEVTTGVRAINVAITQGVWDETKTKEDTVKFLYKVGKRMEEVINKVGSSNLDKLIEDSKKNNLEKIGEMPPIEDADTDWMTDEISDVTH
ncbi:hypothetical protein [Bacillus wiedmannii]|uniref:Phage protein n=1 Tax=Bacillus wiedmannii TaxID=1890302 RepID=A0ABX5DL90_9BACI|nr:hypothetical protein [Bacillus wiedmannii]PRT35459.1 hypothetical protein C6357_28730 [Bacillus wiedmannii]